MQQNWRHHVYLLLGLALDKFICGDFAYVKIKGTGHFFRERKREKERKRRRERERERERDEG